MIILIIYFDKLFFNVKMFIKSFVIFVGFCLYIWFIKKYVLCLKIFIFLIIVLFVEMGSFDKWLNIFRGVDLLIFFG